MNTLDDIRNSCSEPGWDGYSGIPISESIIDRAHAILSLLPSYYEVFPCSDGDIQIETPDASIVIIVSQSTYLFCDTDTGNETEFNNPIDVNQLLQVYK